MHSRAFTTKFKRLLNLTGVEGQFLNTIQINPQVIGANRDVGREGDRAWRCVIILEGLAATSKLDENGKRQTAAFHMAGDMPDLMTLHLNLLDSDIRTISDCTVAFIEHGILRALCENHPRLAATLWRTTLIDASIYREWVLNLGRRPALNRMAHLLCEVLCRMDDRGLVTDQVCEFNITQADLGDATGLSVVHVNRTIQALRKKDLIAFANGTLTIKDWDGLASLAGFNPDYLHLDREQKLIH